ncbi:MAG: glycosyltransferase family 2 protein [Clostridia bacterium]|nr:glycosyltransferase family 2 protein [Clostridia bacterium]
MFQQADISVIVPCYNAERYIGDCLESLRAQKEPRIEMIFVDDGSTDATGAILDRFAEGEPRAKVMHVQNGGVSSARNRGLALAAGRYIAFVDADDVLKPESFAMLYRHAVSTGAQIVSANHTVFDMSKGVHVPVETEPKDRKPQEIVKEIIHMHRIYNNIWNKLYDRSLLEGLRLDEGVRIGEDALLNLQLYLRADRAAHLQAQTYVYRVHGASAMAGVRGHSEAHQPMLRAMSGILSREGVKELYFRDFLQTCVWVDEKERGIRACMKTFSSRVMPLVMEHIDAGKIAEGDRMLYAIVSRGLFPAFYMLMRVREKITGKRWGIRR